ncbi:TetR family transcriptional regulator [Humibacillus xanthopallidus]|uniref:TetR family transcriptional regulator n=1 Tax=Humibacillus xanthopallidus TaxID=412689 RepID=A0A543PPN1_9MICO|nr:TetR/AcrR family transcriptional regulator [Humibacillus xanthopallidus]TQN46029.1 TetR family transcriptional regulator [Humibacillus xanthopallidus]
MTATSRRTPRHEATLQSILDRSVEIMAEVGVAGLTMTRLARALSIQPPSLYKWFPSVLAVHDAVFARGQRANLAAWRDGIAGAETGLVALFAGMTATARWAVTHPVEAQLLFWRPVPGFRPSAEAMAPADELVAELGEAIGHAVARGQLASEADSTEGLVILASLHFGVLSQHLANEPETTWDEGLYTSAYRRVIDLFVAAFPPG